MASSGGDRSNGYDALASEHIARRQQSRIGVATVREWAKSLRPGSAILELGCGSGEPISIALAADGFTIYGVDASPRMVAAFREKLPLAHAACEPVEESRFFEQTFDAILAWGLMFLLPPDVQASVIRKAASALNPGGRFLFTSPAQPCTWLDILTNRRSVSLGAETYRALLAAAGLAMVGEYEDEGDNHYYDAAK